MDLHRFFASCPPSPRVPWARCAQCASPLRQDGVACTGAKQHAVAAPTLRLYATQTSTRANLREMHARGVRVLVGPDQLERYGRDQPFLSYALDNGAWGCHRRGMSFDGDAFSRALDRWGSAADWIVLPDVVADGPASLDLSLRWVDIVAAYGRPALLPVQDGVDVASVRAVLPRVGGIFVGGSTTWKEATVRAWCVLARERGAHIHVGRVNSARRIALCVDAGAHSADGTSLTRYASTASRLDRAARAPRHPSLF